MVFHLIAISKQTDNSIGYVFSSDKLSLIKEDLKELRSCTRMAHIDNYSIHTITTDSHDYKSIIQYDSYFKDTQFTLSKEDFIKQLEAQLFPTSKEVASYIAKKFHLGTFALMKTIYYLYADYIEAHKKPLFKAEFQAWDEGPVEKSVWVLKKHHISNLKNADDVRIKQIGDFNILAYIDQFVEKNGAYLESVKFSEDNPTHRLGTPWSVVRQSEVRNALITDEDILKYHYKEKIPV
ncbi:hypothetical protein Lmede01_03920 [Leuconostoc mesenteroides subsp. dextranicum]|uniref:type II toxin-antitoxin system antitoxin SocA domain-containing protein n=1 Tax=Leuconostoc mesenteroides TaxID=1245 RepID=UPI0021A8A93B|nr:type II toxin-antitoxin system antitoxin SocA domain-containing protein [Leuconostoc mesenteroides]MCT3048469.1 DUF4065 domain-containing protein [Leuconostoc mesenteroides]GLX32414.1 hypothetical protein Lmede01_03920 [Leuconostoc mesenteroides subsp. dextranicum]